MVFGFLDWKESYVRRVYLPLYKGDMGSSNVHRVDSTTKVRHIWISSPVPEEEEKGSGAVR